MLKLFALPSLYRQGRFEKFDLYQNDLLRLLRELELEVEPLLNQLSQHLLPSDIEELREIVASIKAEIADSKRRFSSDD